MSISVFQKCVVPTKFVIYVFYYQMNYILYHITGKLEYTLDLDD